MEFYTIGVYNSSAEQFFQKLTENKIDTFCDIRQRRAVRGSEYVFVNSQRLQDRLAELGISYIHILDLSAPASMRELQKKADERKGEGLKKRSALDKSFIDEYKKNVLKNFDFGNFIDELKKAGSKKIVLFCVEEKAKACHRSIVAEELRDNFNFKVKHL